MTATMKPIMKTSILLSLGVCASLCIPSTADAFCGFYVSGAGGQMFNNATQVVLMREGTRTVMSMQNNYQGPPANFAMVVPVPVVLQEENVKTLDKAIFSRVDQLAAPRLVEYWEQDPCAPQMDYKDFAPGSGRATGLRKEHKTLSDKDLGVTVEAQFTVGEYEIVILSAKDSTGLDTWLKQESYHIPEGAEPLLRPYVQAGSKFFVAKVNTDKVTFKDGMAMLSPLRFHYDDDKFALPVRLGMINSGGAQDLIVHILAKNKRYQVANYKNATIPTNLDVTDEVRARFGEFYAALFDATLEKNPGAVITEYSWDASSCDPCPTPALSPSELATLGEDVLYLPPSASADKKSKSKSSANDPGPSRWSGFVLTRLHARYGKGDLADDLVFAEAPGIAGGREFLSDDGKLEHGAQAWGANNFQARYAIRHEWTGPIECESPRRGIWGGPPAGVPGSSKPEPAVDLAFVTRGKVKLATMVKSDIPELAVAAAGATPASGQDTGQGATPTPKTTSAQPASQPQTTKKQNKGCSASTPGQGHVPGLVLGLLGLLALSASSRRRSGRPGRSSRASRASRGHA